MVLIHLVDLPTSVHSEAPKLGRRGSRHKVNWGIGDQSKLPDSYTELGGMIKDGSKGNYGVHTYVRCNEEGGNMEEHDPVH